MMNIAVMVPTFRRPALLLEVLESLAGQQNKPYCIVVSDNDPDLADGLKVALKWASNNEAGKLIRTTIATARGLSQNRNHGLSLAFSDPQVDAVAMIDDDSEALPYWLRNINPALSGGFMLVGGPTIYRLPASVPDRIRSSDMFSLPYQASGQVSSLRSANNCTLVRGIFDRYDGQVFDERFGATGGEDTHFFALEKVRNTKVWWAADAEVYEDVPLSRCSYQWISDRHQTSAANAARVDLSVYGPATAYPRQILFAAKEIAAGAAHLCIGSDHWTVKERVGGAIGRLRGLFGYRPSHESADKEATSL